MRVYTTDMVTARLMRLRKGATTDMAAAESLKKAVTLCTGAPLRINIVDQTSLLQRS